MQQSTFPTLQTERLDLRPISEEDAEFYLSLMQTDKWIKFIGDRGVHNPTQARDYIRDRMLSQWMAVGYGNYVVVRRQDGVCMGACGIFTRPGLDSADIGFAFLPQYEKQGYAFEAASRVKQEAFTVFGLEKLLAITDPSNVDSHRLLNKLQFTLQGSIILPNETKETLVYTCHNSS